MKCPVDNATLMMTERAGVEIDYCPECRGVWLDRGELDKIISKAAEPASDNRVSRESREHDDDGAREYRYEDRDDDKHDKYPDGKKKRRGSFVEDLFGGFGD